MAYQSDIPETCPIGRAFCSQTCEHYDALGGGVGPVSWPACMYRRESDPCPLVRAGVEGPGVGDCERCRWGAMHADQGVPWPDRCALAAHPEMDERIAVIREYREDEDDR